MNRVLLRVLINNIAIKISSKQASTQYERNKKIIISPIKVHRKKSGYNNCIPRYTPSQQKAEKLLNYLVKVIATKADKTII